MIIGLSGKKRVGKNTVGMYLDLKHGIYNLSFAKKLKELARSLGWDGRKDEPGRKLLQDLGAVIRTYNEDYFVDYLQGELEKLKQEEPELTRFAITDVRFANEAAWVKSKGGVVIRVWGKDEITDDIHISETALDDYEFDYKIESIYGDFNDLYRKVDAIIPNLGVPVLGGGEPERMV